MDPFTPTLLDACGIEIGDGVQVTVQTGVIGDLEAGGTYTGFPARPHREAMRGYAHVTRLPRLDQRLKALEDEVARLVNG